MKKTKECPQKTLSVAIIGAGFSGTMLAANLIQKVPKDLSLQISLIDKSGVFAQGPAFSTKDPNHLLNVRVKRMGAYKDDPEHFLKWIIANENIWKPLFPDLIIDGDSYVPRYIYGLYLTSILNNTIAEAKKKNSKISCTVNEAIDVIPCNDNSLKIRLADHEIVTDVIILANNLPFHSSFDMDPDLSENAFIDSIWTMPMHHPLSIENLNSLTEDTAIGIIGSGLTMVDAVVGLINKGYKGKFIVLSQHGQMPESHLTADFLHLPSTAASKFIKFPISLRCLVRMIREEVKIQEAKGVNWRTVIDSLRPITTPLWEQLPFQQKKAFVTHVLSLWNRLRHRVPPQSYNIIENCIQKGALEFIAGRVKAIHKSPTSNRVQIIAKQIVEVDYVINCSGPQPNLLKTNSALFKNMIKRGIIIPHPLNVGLCVDDHYQVENAVKLQGGKFKLPIYAMGQLLMGQKLETVAVPELREQCAFIANDIFMKETGYVLQNSEKIDF